MPIGMLANELKAFHMRLAFNLLLFSLSGFIMDFYKNGRYMSNYQSFLFKAC